MPTLPAASSFTGSTVTEAQFKTAITDQREFLAGLLGTAGTQAAALAALGADLNGVLSKSAAYSVVAADRGKLIDCTTGTWTLTLLAAVTAGDGFVFGARNSGTGVLTIDPNSTEQIDGASTITLNAGESCLVVCSGTAWKTVGKSSSGGLKVQVVNLVTGTSYVPPSGAKALFVMVRGSTGGCVSGSANGRGGVGGAGYSEKLYTAPLSASYSFSIGAGGANTGTQGGTTTFDVMSITGSGGVTGSTGSSGGTASGGTFNANGGSGGGGVTGNIGGSGGGGGGGSRSGAGYAGGSGATDVSGGGGGGGGGTSSVGGNAAATVAGTAGSSSTTESGSAVTMHSDVSRSQSPLVSAAASAGASGGGNYGGRGGSGATQWSVYPLAAAQGAPGGPGGTCYTAPTAFTGANGSITVLEIF